jgi:BTB/POZ domain
MGSESVIIHVGQERKRYLIHKNLLMQSDYFKNAFNGNFKEAEDQMMDLPEESPAAFDLLISFLYQDRIPIIDPGKGLFKNTKAIPAVKISSDGQTAAHTIRPNLFPPTLSTLVHPLGYVSGTTSQTGAENADSIYPQNDGTGSVPYRPSPEQPHTASVQQGPQIATPVDICQSICFLQYYKRWSPEELRFADYASGRGVFTRTSTTAASSGSSPASAALSQNTFLAGIPFGKPGPIPGIPKCPSMAEISQKEEDHQLAVLKLCIFAETTCWDKLFNRAMAAYTRGEANLRHRTLPSTQIELIYQRTHETSPCRQFVADAVVSQLQNPTSHPQYLELTRKYPEFLQDLFKSIAKNPTISLRDPLKAHICLYHVHPDGQRCAGFEQWEKGRGKTEALHTREWMTYQGHRATESILDWIGGAGYAEVDNSEGGEDILRWPF